MAWAFFSDVLLTSITIHLHKQKEFNHFINVKNVFQTRIISTCSLQSNIFYARFQFSMAFHQHIQFISPSPSELCHTFDKPNGVIDYLFSFFFSIVFQFILFGVHHNEPKLFDENMCVCVCVYALCKQTQQNDEQRKSTTAQTILISLYGAFFPAAFGLILLCLCLCVRIRTRVALK